VYLQTVRDFVARTWQGWENEHGPRAADLMYYTGFLYRQDNETQWLDHVAQWLADAEKHLGAKPDSGGTPWYVEHMGWGIRWYRGSPRWTPDVEQTARRVMLIATGKLAESLERGAMNRTVWDVQLTRLASDLYPDAPDAPAWRAFSDEAWHDWADFDDTEEDSSHYNAVFLHFMLGHALQTDQLSLFRRPGMKRWMDRYRDLIAPNGMMVGWGDSVGCGADWGGWVAAFEAAAAQTGDGTYKWAAHQLLDGHRRSMVSDEPLQQGYEDMHSLTLAYMLADHTVQPVTPSAKSEVLTTTYPRYNPPQARRDQKLPYFSLERRLTPWKLVMRDSPGDQACYALFGLLPYGGHGHADAPALLSLFANETLLLNDTSYFHRDWSDHNLLYGVRLSGGAIGAAPTETEVKAFKATDALCYADVAWRDYAGYGLAFRREILFVKGLGWWIRDRTEATDPCEWLLGPLWHVDRILSRGDTWFDVDCPVPMSFAWPMANGTDHLLVYFTPQTEAVVDYADMRHRVDEKRPWYSSAPWAPYQCGGPLRLAAGRQAHFSTLLLPLRADESAEAAATNVQTILDEPAATVLRVQRGGTAWRMALNNDGRRLDLGAVATTARAVVVRATQGEKPSVEAVDQ